MGGRQEGSSSGRNPAEYMVVRELQIDEVREVYRKYLTEDFPPDELRPLYMIEEAMQEKRYTCFGCFDEDGAFVGYAFFASRETDRGKDYLFDYLAVVREKRDKGIGTAFFGGLYEALKDAASVVGEVENPDYAESEEERAYREWRIKFYLRNGLLDTGVTVLLYGVEYRVMEMPVNGAHTAEEVREIYSGLYQSILPPKMFEEIFLLHEPGA